VSTSRTVARNTLLNLLGQGTPMIAAIIGIPILIHHLGAARFGVLTLAWAAIGYFSLFDLGLGRALTQAVAMRLGAEEDADDLRAVAWTALWLMLGLGIVGGIVLAAGSPWIVRSGLNIPPGLQRESLESFYLLALSLPLVVTAAGLRGLLEAHQHFGAVAALRAPLAIFTFIAPLAVLPYSSRLTPVVAVLVVGRLLTWAAYLVVCLRRYDYMRAGFELRRRAVMPLLRFGGWMTVSNIVSPLMAYLDRFFIGAILPLAAVAYYVTPYEMVSKLLVLPQAMIAALFPAFASTYAKDREGTAVLFERALRALWLLMFPIMLVIALFAREGLSLWVGADFARQSTEVLQWMAAGLFLNSLAQAPFAALQGIGRPDLTAKLHLVELPIYLAALWSLAHRFGIAGVAMAWTIRVAIDAGLLFALTRHLMPRAPLHTCRNTVLVTGGLAAIAAASAVTGTLGKLAFLGVSVMLFLVLAWNRIVLPLERRALLEWSLSLLGRRTTTHRHAPGAIPFDPTSATRSE
jgi:O-antigen/teichoic acid export membrane protein